MKISVTILLLLSLNTVLAQDKVLFKVITCPEGAMIGTTPLKPGMDILESSGEEKITVPSKTFIGIIVASGEIYKLKKSMRASKVPRIATTPQLKATGAVHRGANEFYHFPLSPDNNSDFLGDSLFVYWVEANPMDYTMVSPPKRDNYTFQLLDLYLDVVMSIDTKTNWVLINIDDSLKNRPLLYQLAGNRISQQYLVKGPKDVERQNVERDLEYFRNDSDRLFYECSVYQFEDHAHDQLYTIYKILSRNINAKDPILASYFKWLGEKYYFSMIKLN